MPDILENGLQRWTPVILVTKNDKRPPEEWSIDRVYKFFRTKPSKPYGTDIISASAPA